MIEFAAANWLWILLIAAMLFMHRGGGCGSHGGHAGHGDHRRHGDRPTDRTRGGSPEPLDPVPAEPADDAGTPGHRHAG